MSQTSLLRGPEWPTLVLIAAVYLLWIGLTLFGGVIGAMPSVLGLSLLLTLHSSLQHEVLHGHPLPSRKLSAALVWPPLGLAIPYERFRDQHLAHHRDANLTDPYDDPESNYLDPAVWASLPWPVRAVLGFNNTLLGRMIVGPAVALTVFLRDELRGLRRGDPGLRGVWARHAAGVAGLLAWLGWVGTLPVWAYVVGAYLALSVLKIRTFLEHQAHERAMGRSVIIEDRGPLAFLFLNNNLHAVHHAHPQVAWYLLPRLYAARRAEFLRRNLGYRYASYGAVLRLHLLRRKDPVPHPLWPNG